MKKIQEEKELYCKEIEKQLENAMKTKDYWQAIEICESKGEECSKCEESINY